MKTREQKQESYTEADGELLPLTWGKVRLLQPVLEAAEEEDIPELAAYVYHHDLKACRHAVRNGTLAKDAKKYAEQTPLRKVLDCVAALKNDVGAIEASMFEPEDSGKGEGEE